MHYWVELIFLKMATNKQKSALKKMVENGGNVSQAMRDSGYSKETAKNPQKLTKSKGFQELCEECGLTDELILFSLVSDIKNKPGSRRGELELALKIKGLLKNKTELHVETTAVDLFGKSHAEILKFEMNT